MSTAALHCSLLQDLYTMTLIAAQTTMNVISSIYISPYFLIYVLAFIFVWKTTLIQVSILFDVMLSDIFTRGF